VLENLGFSKSGSTSLSILGVLNRLHVNTDLHVKLGGKRQHKSMLEYTYSTLFPWFRAKDRAESADKVRHGSRLTVD
jgi:hypothetical protein